MKRHDCKNWIHPLEALIDGELEELEEAKLRHELESCADCRSRIEAITEMGDLLRAEVREAVDSADFGILWPVIESSLEAEVSTTINPLQIQAFADGEVSGRELITIADHVAISLEAHRQVDAIAEMGELLRFAADEAAQSTDFAPLWSRLDQAVGADIDARGELPVASAENRASERVTWWDRVLAAIGGYRSVLLSAATAVIVVLLMLPSWGGDQTQVDQRTTASHPEQQLDIRVVHVNEVVSNPGHQVTVDSNDGFAPVIFIRSEEDQTEENLDLNDSDSERNEIYRDPI